MDNYNFYLTMIALIWLLLTLYIIMTMGKKYRKAKKYNLEILEIFIPKGTILKLRGYAVIKGYKNENEFIAALIDNELKKDKEILENNKNEE